MSSRHCAEIYAQVLNLLVVEKLYLSPDTTAVSLAERIGCTPRQISACVQMNSEGNFRTLINSMRLKEVCRRLASPRYASMSVEDIGLTCGFRSRQAFYLAFGREHNCSPAQWREQQAESMTEEGLAQE